jgi:hypothetical protein
MKNTVMVIIFLFLLAACDNAVNDNVINPDTDSPDSPADSNTYTITYSAGGPDVSRFLGWQWAKDGSDFIWIFKNDGTVSVIHCCGEVYHRQFSYLLCGNVLITYGSETSFDEMEATVFTMAETDNGVSFTRDNGTKFIRGEADTGSSPDSPLDLSNDLLGTWQGENGAEYEFSSDTGLRITSPSDSGQYGYFVRYAELLTLGPLVDGTQAVLQKYKFDQRGNKLYLRRSDGQKYTLSLLE